MVIRRLAALTFFFLFQTTSVLAVSEKAILKFEAHLQKLSKTMEKLRQNNESLFRLNENLMDAQNTQFRPSFFPHFHGESSFWPEFRARRYGEDLQKRFDQLDSKERALTDREKRKKLEKKTSYLSRLKWKLDNKRSDFTLNLARDTLQSLRQKSASISDEEIGFLEDELKRLEADVERFREDLTKLKPAKAVLDTLEAPKRLKQFLNHSYCKDHFSNWQTLKNFFLKAPKLLTSTENSILFFAARQQNLPEKSLNTLSKLPDEEFFKKTDAQGWPPLFHALEARNVPMTAWLIDRLTDIRNKQPAYRKEINSQLEEALWRFLPKGGYAGARKDNQVSPSELFGILKLGSLLSTEPKEELSSEAIANAPFHFRDSPQPMEALKKQFIDRAFSETDSQLIAHSDLLAPLLGKDLRNPVHPEAWLNLIKAKIENKKNEKKEVYCDLDLSSLLERNFGPLCTKRLELGRFPEHSLQEMKNIKIPLARGIEPPFDTPQQILITDWNRLSALDHLILSVDQDTAPAGKPSSKNKAISNFVKMLIRIAGESMNGDIIEEIQDQFVLAIDRHLVPGVDPYALSSFVRMASHLGNQKPDSLNESSYQNKIVSSLIGKEDSQLSVQSVQILSLLKLSKGPSQSHWARALNAKVQDLKTSLQLKNGTSPPVVHCEEKLSRFLKAHYPEYQFCTP